MKRLPTIILGLLLLLLTACSSATPNVTTPTPRAVGGAQLPAPLYVLDNGQIARIERDGTTRALVTSETIEVQGFPPVATFGISPQGTLAFVVGDLKADRLVLSGPKGEDRRVRYEVEGHELSDIVWSPDGSQIYLRLLNNLDPPDIPSGIYRMAAADGPLELLLADEPLPNAANSMQMAREYRPFMIAPDGSRLLVEVDDLTQNSCTLAILPRDGSALLNLTPPDGLAIYCGDADWSADAARVALLAGDGAGPQLWQVDAQSGAMLALATTNVLARAPLWMPDGGLRFIWASREGGQGKLQFALAQLDAAQPTPAMIGPIFREPLGQVLWAADGSGAVTVVAPEDQVVDLRWMPVNGEALVLPNTKQRIGDIAWGPVE
ncbi:hypothetical protein OSCT_1138 [Oscillochloris trichoides DG-6]|uniref:Uncharacterized protein n=1 Tax=Oscillochloris trichoides DG-6 TaxID=765420 RepID=E1ICT7_9CHLR|nr:hypothetical protein [Oscillochloris trichoides]EFO81035.1 hypothetical protein OSCT_1138 [Oscillochloris trichoides DG-6]